MRRWIEAAVRLPSTKPTPTSTDQAWRNALHHPSRRSTAFTWAEAPASTRVHRDRTVICKPTCAACANPQIRFRGTFARHTDSTLRGASPKLEATRRAAARSTASSGTTSTCWKTAPSDGYWETTTGSFMAVTYLTPAAGPVRGCSRTLTTLDWADRKLVYNHTAGNGAGSTWYARHLDSCLITTA